MFIQLKFTQCAREKAADAASDFSVKNVVRCVILEPRKSQQDFRSNFDKQSDHFTVFSPKENIQPRAALLLEDCFETNMQI